MAYSQEMLEYMTKEHYEQEEVDEFADVVRDNVVDDTEVVRLQELYQKYHPHGTHFEQLLNILRSMTLENDSKQVPQSPSMDDAVRLEQIKMTKDLNVAEDMVNLYDIEVEEDSRGVTIKNIRPKGTITVSEDMKKAYDEYNQWRFGKSNDFYWRCATSASVLNKWMVLFGLNADDVVSISAMLILAYRSPLGAFFRNSIATRWAASGLRWSTRVVNLVKLAASGGTIGALKTAGYTGQGFLIAALADMLFGVLVAQIRPTKREVSAIVSQYLVEFKRLGWLTDEDYDLAVATYPSRITAMYGGELY